jgi:hypothetical protein
MKNNPLVSLQGMVPDADSNPYFSLQRIANKPLHRSRKNKKGKIVVDYGIILRVYSPGSTPARCIVCAGLGEFATAGAAWYLANRFEEIAPDLTGSETDFLCLLQVIGNQETKAIMIGKPFERLAGKTSKNALLAWQANILARTKRSILTR